MDSIIGRSHRFAGVRRAAMSLAIVLLPSHWPLGAIAAERTLTVGRPRTPIAVPVVPSPVLPGAPIPWSGSPVLTPLTVPIVDGQTRFLTEGVAQAHCPGDRVLFFSGVVNPFRPTIPGDGAFICHQDAVAEGFAGP